MLESSLEGGLVKSSAMLSLKTSQLSPQIDSLSAYTSCKLPQLSFLRALCSQLAHFIHELGNDKETSFRSISVAYH